MSDKLLFEYKIFGGQGLWVYEDKIIIAPKIASKTTIPLSKIASVSCSAFGNITIETTGGKEFSLLCGKRGKEAKEIIDQLTL
jgi:hypothetical protein